MYTALIGVCQQIVARRPRIRAMTSDLPLICLRAAAAAAAAAAVVIIINRCRPASHDAAIVG